MKITCLTENTSCSPELGCEHGLSLYIEANGKNILFDMGQTELFAKNADKLGIDLEEVDLAVLSHGHYDHGGGLKTFFDINQKADVFISKYAFMPHYNKDGKYIGLDTAVINSPRIKFTEGNTVIGDGLTLHSCNKRKKEYDIGTFGMTYISEGKILPEDFRHEQYLLITEGEKNVLISGCSHKGIIDITKWFAPQVLVGGFHFSKFPLDEKLIGYAKLLDGFNTVYYTCHCTGKEQYDFMKPYIKNLNMISTGDAIVL